VALPPAPTEAVVDDLKAGLLDGFSTIPALSHVDAEDIVITNYQKAEDGTVTFDYTVNVPPSPPAVSGSFELSGDLPAPTSGENPDPETQAKIEKSVLDSYKTVPGLADISPEDIEVVAVWDGTQYQVDYVVKIPEPPEAIEQQISIGGGSAALPPNPDGSISDAAEEQVVSTLYDSLAGLPGFSELSPSDITITEALYDEGTGTWDITYEIVVPDPPVVVASQITLGGGNIPAGPAAPGTPEAEAADAAIAANLAQSLGTIPGFKGVDAEDIIITSKSWNNATGQWDVEYEVAVGAPPALVDQSITIGGLADYAGIESYVATGVLNAFEKKEIFDKGTLTLDDIVVESVIISGFNAAVVHYTVYFPPRVAGLPYSSEAIASKVAKQFFAIQEEVKTAIRKGVPGSDPSAVTAAPVPSSTKPPSASAAAAALAGASAKVGEASAAISGGNSTASAAVEVPKPKAAPLTAATAAAALTENKVAVESSIIEKVPGATVESKPPTAATVAPATNPAKVAQAASQSDSLASSIAATIPGASAVPGAVGEQKIDTSAAAVAEAANEASAATEAAVAAKTGAAVTVAPSYPAPPKPTPANIEIPVSMTNLPGPGADGKLPASAQNAVKQGVANGMPEGSNVKKEDIEIKSQTYKGTGARRRNLLANNAAWDIVTQINLPVSELTGLPAESPAELAAKVDTSAVSAATAATTGATVDVAEPIVPPQPDPPIAQIDKMLAIDDLPSPNEAGLSDTEKAARQAKIDELEANRNAALLQIKELEDEYNAKVAEKAALQKAADEAKAERAAAQAKIAAAEASRETAAANVAAAEAAVNAAAGAQQAQLDKLAAARAAVEEADAAVAAAKQAEADLAAKKAALDADLAAAQEKLNQLAKDDEAVNNATVVESGKITNTIIATDGQPLAVECPPTVQNCISNPRGQVDDIATPSIPTADCPVCFTGARSANTIDNSTGLFLCKCVIIPVDNSLEDDEIAGIVIVCVLAAAAAGVVGYGVLKKASAGKKAVADAKANEQRLATSGEKADFNPRWQPSGAMAQQQPASTRAAAAAAPAPVPVPVQAAAAASGVQSFPITSAPAPAPAYVMAPEPAPIEAGDIDLGMPEQRPQAAAMAMAQEAEASQLPTTQQAEKPVSSSAFEFLGKKK